MTGRYYGMDASRTAPRGSRGVACLIAGLLCALGVLAGAALHPGEATHHRTPVVAMATQIADSHSANLRGDQQLTAATPIPVLRSPLHTSTTASVSPASTGTAIDSVRTRGPPVPA